MIRIIDNLPKGYSLLVHDQGIEIKRDISKFPKDFHNHINSGLYIDAEVELLEPIFGIDETNFIKDQQLILQPIGHRYQEEYIADLHIHAPFEIVKNGRVTRRVIEGFVIQV